MNNQTIGIDLGGTNIRGGLVSESNLSSILSQKVSASGSVDDVLKELFSLIDKLINSSVNAIGIGVPGLVDTEHALFMTS